MRIVIPLNYESYCHSRIDKWNTSPQLNALSFVGHQTILALPLSSKMLYFLLRYFRPHCVSSQISDALFALLVSVRAVSKGEVFAYVIEDKT